MFDLIDKKIFIIGGAGLIGSHICDELKKTNVKKVTIFDNMTRGKLSNLNNVLSDSRFNLIEDDITFYQRLLYNMQDHDIVIHLAAIWLNHCQEFPQIAFEQNLEGTNNVFKAAIECGINNIVFSSSASVYGEPKETVITEDSAYNNTTFYGATKISGEHLLKAYCSKYGIKGVSLRYFNVYGPRQDYEGAYISVVTRMIDNVLKGLPLVIYGDGSQSFDFIYVGDIARANLYSINTNRGNSYEVYNVCSGKTTSIKHLAELISEIAGVTPKFEYVNSTFPVSFRLGDPTKAKQIGFTSHTSIREGLKNLIEWRKSLGDL